MPPRHRSEGLFTGLAERAGMRVRAFVLTGFRSDGFVDSSGVGWRDDVERELAGAPTPRGSGGTDPRGARAGRARRRPAVPRRAEPRLASADRVAPASST